MKSKDYSIIKSNIGTKLLPVSAFAALLAGSFPTDAKAAFTLYTDRGAWQSAVTIIGLETFNSYSSDGAFASPLFTISGSGAVIVDVQPYNDNPGSANIDGTPRLNFDGVTTPVFLTLAFGVSAIGFDTVNYDVGDDRLNVFINGGSSMGFFPPTRDQTGFLGVVSDGGDDILNLVFVGPGSSTYNAMDNVTIGAVPEPSGALFGAAGALLALRRRRRA